MIRIGLIGATGRLGQCIAKLALQTNDFHLAKVFTHAGSRFLGQKMEDLSLSTDLLDPSFDLYIDASLPTALATNLNAAIASHRPIVLGSTGFSEEEHALLQNAAKTIPVFYSPNFSLGMAILRKLAIYVSQLFEGDIELTETHHTQKKDAPSGSAILLAKSIEESHPSKKSPKIQSLRIENAIGKHEILFRGLEEELTLSHAVQSRNAFAKGALAAARFILRQPPGLYGMDDL